MVSFEIKMCESSDLKNIYCFGYSGSWSGVFNARVLFPLKILATGGRGQRWWLTEGIVTEHDTAAV